MDNNTSNPKRPKSYGSRDGQRDRRTIEWYDFFLYGVVAASCQQAVFPGGDPLVSTMLAYGTFAVGFLSRPIAA